MKEIAFFLCVTTLVILFAGTPDIHDRIMQRLDCVAEAGK